MTRREVLDAKLGDEARQIQPRRFEIVLRCVARRPSSDDVARFSHPTQPRRDAISAPFPPPRRALSLTRPPLATPRRKPLAPVNGWSNVLAPKSAFKTPGVTPGGGLTRRVSFKPDPAVADDAAWRSLETPAQRPPASRRRVTHRRAGMRARKGTGRAVAARTFSLVLRAPHERSTQLYAGRRRRKHRTWRRVASERREVAVRVRGHRQSRRQRRQRQRRRRLRRGARPGALLFIRQARDRRRARG